MYDVQESKLVASPKAAAQEFCILSCLGPILASNISVSIQQIFAERNGGERISLGGRQVAWRTADKGERVPMLRLPEAVVAQRDTMFERLPRNAGFRGEFAGAVDRARNVEDAGVSRRYPQAHQASFSVLGAMRRCWRNDSRSSCHRPFF